MLVFGGVSHLMTILVGFFGEEIPKGHDLNIPYYKSVYMYSVHMYIAQPTRGPCTH